MELFRKKEQKEKKQKEKKQKEKKQKEPQYYQSVTNTEVLNYRVYILRNWEKLLYGLLAFAAGAAVGYLFYGGIGRDAYGNPTNVTRVLNLLIPSVVGGVAAVFFFPVRADQMKEKRQKQLREQFRDMLEGLTTSLGAGNNVNDAFLSVRDDLRIQYEEDAYILKELDVIISGIQNNVAIEEVIYDFGVRSGIEDIVSFSEVFRVSYRKGGNIQDIIQNTHSILSEKMEMQEEIETVISSGKMEQNIMVVMPVVLIGMLKIISPELGDNLTTGSGIFSTTFAIICFGAAYFVGKKIMDIKI